MGYKLLCCKVISLMMGKFRFHIVYFVLRNLCYFSGIFSWKRIVKLIWSVNLYCLALYHSGKEKSKFFLVLLIT